jgi:predicted DsbA family dithiol-disulfide isomerase
MKIEIWSDIACPFCYIGKHRLQLALNDFPHQDKVEIIYKSFQLDPNAPKRATSDIHQILANKYGMSREEAVSANQNISEQASQLGLTFNYDTLISTNTLDAHRLIQYAKTKGLSHVMLERCFKAYFSDGLNISDIDTLINCASEIGLEQLDVKSILESDAYLDEVKNDLNQGMEYGITSVPTYIFNEQYVIKGAQAPQTFLNALNAVWKHEQEQK